MQEKRKYVIHPHKIAMYLIITAITVLFLGFSAAYIFTRYTSDAPPVALPWLFYVNTLILLGSSGTLLWAKKSYLNDNTDGFKYGIIGTLVLTLVFLGSQIFAWQQLYNNEIFVNYNNLASYMYLISAVHFLHVIIGIPFLVRFIIDAYRKMKSPVTVLLYFADEDKKRRLDLFNIYWHYLDGLWIYLVLFLLVNYFI